MIITHILGTFRMNIYMVMDKFKILYQYKVCLIGELFLNKEMEKSTIYQVKQEKMFHKRVKLIIKKL